MKKAGVIAGIFLILIVSLVSAQDERGTIIVDIAGGDCNLNLKPGWNLFSFCSELQNTDLLDILSQIEGKYRYIMEWDLNTQEFNIYSPRAIQKPFTTFNDDKSYFIYMEQEATLDVPGLESGAESRNLITGWNTPSYPYRFLTLITDMISGIVNDVRYIMKWDNINQEFDIYSTRSITKPFDYITTSEGQFIYMNNPNTLNYPGR